MASVPEAGTEREMPPMVAVQRSPLRTAEGSVSVTEEKFVEPAWLWSASTPEIDAVPVGATPEMASVTVLTAEPMWITREPVAGAARPALEASCAAIVAAVSPAAAA